MREIKFRAWDKSSKRMLQVSGISLEDGAITFRKQGKESTFNILIPPGDTELMQYIGLKDKNDKEIYEGDIVRIWDYGFKDGNEDGDFDLYQDMGVDKVTMDRFPIYWLAKEEFGYEGEDLINPKLCEVIGNIYENPELLK